MSKHKFGPTGAYPRGSVGPGDRGELRIGIAHDSKGNVVINFGTECSWIAMPPEQAIMFAKTILKHCGATRIEVEFGKNDEAFRKNFEIPIDTNKAGDKE